jgi:hypothetical protein
MNRPDSRTPPATQPVRCRLRIGGEWTKRDV